MTTATMTKIIINASEDVEKEKNSYTVIIFDM
jgi:hypothetical protein